MRLLRVLLFGLAVLASQTSALLDVKRCESEPALRPQLKGPNAGADTLLKPKIVGAVPSHGESD